MRIIVVGMHPMIGPDLVRLGEVSSGPQAKSRHLVARWRLLTQSSDLNFCRHVRTDKRGQARFQSLRLPSLKRWIGI
jgi:hypothetical protein